MLRVAESYSGTHTGRQRRANEDSHYARAPLFAVADGMGGAQAGEIASRIAVETIGADAGAGPGDLAKIVQTANERIHELSRSDERRAGMGTTMTVVLVGEEEIHVAHVGDSRAYLWRGGQLERLTRDHSLVDELVRQGKLTPEEAQEHPQRSVITRAVGPEARVEVDTDTWQAKAGDVFLICSDGLTTMIGEPAIEQILEGAPTLEDAGHQLIDAANDAGGRDNITVVLFRLEEIEAVARERSAAAEQDTMAGEAGAVTTGDVQAAIEAEERKTSVATVARAEPDPLTTSRRLEPVKPGDLRRGGTTPPAGPKPKPRWRRALVVAAVLGMILVPIALGTFVALRSVYFVGTDDSGFVAVYRGVPWELPLGLELYQVNYRSGVHRDQVPGARRETVLDQEWRSQEDAYDLVRRLERGEVS
jgi:PPM family protein phosphatase